MEYDEKEGKSLRRRRRKRKWKAKRVRKEYGMEDLLGKNVPNLGFLD